MFARLTTCTAALALIALSTFNDGVATADHHGSSEKLLKEIAGTWVIEEGVNQGEKLTEDELEGTTMVITNKTIVTYDRDQNETYRATFTLDCSKKPFQIDMTTQMKRVPPSKALGILKLEDGGEFEICYALPGAERPTQFESPEGSQVMLFECEKKE